jgi:hypothetical protein
MALENEIETYHRKLPELLPDKGKYVVIHGDEVVGIRDTLNEALALGYERFLGEPFLVRKIQETDPMLISSRSLRPCPLPTEQSPPIEGRPSNS